MFVNHWGGASVFILVGGALNCGTFMDKVEADIDDLRASVHELKSSLYRADRAHAQSNDSVGFPLFFNVTATCVLALFFLLL